jgi:hypothetical protein
MEVRKHSCLSFYEPNQERVLICDKEKEAERGGER